MSTHNLCFCAKIRNNAYPYKPQLYCINIGCKGVYITRTCFHDDYLNMFMQFIATFATEEMIQPADKKK